MEKTGEKNETGFGRKRAAVVAAAAVVVVALIAVIILMQGKKEAYRSIQVYTIEGEAFIEREGIGEIGAYANLYLESGDTVRVSEDSSMRLKLDEDKYILAEENTVFSVTAEGNEKDSRTTINLKQGAVTSEIKNPLSSRSSYEIETPNAVMAVRGTCFRTFVEKMADGSSHTVLETFDGVVASRLKYPDGTLAEDEVLVNAGEKIEVTGNETETEYISKPAEIDYSSLPLETLGFLYDTAQIGSDAGITAEELERIIQEKTKREEAEKEKTEEKTGEPDEAQQEKEKSAKNGDEESRAENVKRTKNQPDDKKKEQSLPKDRKSKGADSENVGNKDTGNGNAESGNNGSGGSQDESSDDSGENRKKVYQVTFLYHGEVFGMQEVKRGKKAEIPSLAPSDRGGWDYDFSEPVTKDIEIYWRGEW